MVLLGVIHLWSRWLIGVVFVWVCSEEFLLGKGLLEVLGSWLDVVPYPVALLWVIIN